MTTEQERDCRPEYPCCWHCGERCSGDTTEEIVIDGVRGEVVVCDVCERTATP